MTYEAPTYAHGGTYYLPADWMDEIIPDLAAAPIDFAELDSNGQWWLRLPVGNPDRDNNYYQTKIEPDHAISWNERRLYGSFDLVVNADGTWVCEGVPADANCFCSCGMGDDIFDSISDLVERGKVDRPNGPIPAGKYEIEAWYWGDDISLLFEVTDGQPSFREVGHA